MSVHKNFIEWYWRDWNKLCSEKLLPYQNEIFELFSEKFYVDAEKDGEKWRKVLKSRWGKCGEICNEIYLTLWWNGVVSEDLRDLIISVVNLDYNSLLEVFQVLRNEYLKVWNQWVANQIWIICFYLEKMWWISKSHTMIKNE